MRSPFHFGVAVASAAAEALDAEHAAAARIDAHAKHARPAAIVSGHDPARTAAVGVANAADTLTLRDVDGIAAVEVAAVATVPAVIVAVARIDADAFGRDDDALGARRSRRGHAREAEAQGRRKQSGTDDLFHEWFSISLIPRATSQ